MRKTLIRGVSPANVLVSYSFKFGTAKTRAYGMLRHISNPINITEFIFFYLFIVAIGIRFAS